jgi:transcriptional regulator with XRE-family HTH domain
VKGACLKEGSAGRLKNVQRGNKNNNGPVKSNPLTLDKNMTIMIVRITAYRGKGVKAPVDAESFAGYMTRMRKQSGFSLRHMAERLAISPSYYNDIEKGRRNPPDWARLERFAEATGMTRAEKARMLDLAGLACGRVAPDLTEYLLAREDVRAALRAAREGGATCGAWAAFARQFGRAADDGHKNAKDEAARMAEAKGRPAF